MKRNANKATDKRKDIAIRIDPEQYAMLKDEAKREKRSAVAQLETILYLHFIRRKR